MARLGHRRQEAFQIPLLVREGMSGDHEISTLFTQFQQETDVLEQEHVPTLRTLVVLSRLSRLIRLRLSRSLTVYAGDHEQAVRLLRKAYDAMRLPEDADFAIREAKKSIGTRVQSLMQKIKQGSVSIQM